MYDIIIGDYDRTYSSTVVLQYRLKIYLFGCKTSAARDFKSKYCTVDNSMMVPAVLVPAGMVLGIQ